MKRESFYTVSIVIETKVVIGWFKLQLKLCLVDLNYNFECDWLTELPDNKLSDNNLTSELLENRSFLNQYHNRGNSNFYDYCCYHCCLFGFFVVDVFLVFAVGDTVNYNAL